MHLTPIAIPEGLDVQEIGGAKVVEDSLTRVANAAVVLCQGGFSSLSEALALGKRTLAAPLPGHVEQEVNVRLLADRGALCVLEGDLGVALDAMDGFSPALDGLAFDGTQEAARRLSDWAGKSG